MTEASRYLLMKRFPDWHLRVLPIEGLVDLVPAHAARSLLVARSVAITTLKLSHLAHLVSRLWYRIGLYKSTGAASRLFVHFFQRSRT